MKTLTLLLLALTLPSILFAQISGGYGGKMSINDNTHKIEFGIEGSPSLIFLRGNEIMKKYHKPTIGFSGGLSFQYNFRKIFSIRTDISFERKGSELNNIIYYTDQNGNVTGSDQLLVHFHYDYLTFPILVRASIGKKVKYFFDAGLLCSYLINNTIISEETQFVPFTITDNTSLDKRFDTGVSAGLGFVIPIKEKYAISCEIRNNLGLLNVSSTPVYNNGTIKTNSTNFLINFVYRFGKRTYIVPA